MRDSGPPRSDRPLAHILPNLAEEHLETMLLKILVVDDEPSVLRLLKAMVEPRGYEVVTIADSREAVQRVQTERFDGIIVDVFMPYVDGFELARQIRASAVNSSTPIVMITGTNDLDAMRKGFSVGVTFFLAKPFTQDRVHGLFAAARGCMLQERRKHLRLPYRTSVQCAFGEYGEKHFVASSVSLGENGMLLEPSGGLDAGQELTLEFLLPGGGETAELGQRPRRRSIFPGSGPAQGGPRKLQARVARREPPERIAVEFTDLSLGDRKLIQRYVTGASLI